MIPYPLEKGHLFYPYPTCTESTDRELLPGCKNNYIYTIIYYLKSSYLSFFLAFHEVSVYPKKELPFFILFTAGLCSVTALLALLTHSYPEPMGVLAKMVIFINIAYKH